MDTAVTRKLAAILAADAVGYSSRVRDNETAALAELGSCRAIIDPIIRTRGGRIFSTAGDGVLAEFASVVDAAEAALDIQAALGIRKAGAAGTEPMRFRIGLTVGDVVIQGGDLLGDGVNIAARLQAVAQPGTACISPTAWQELQGKGAFVFDSMGDVALKNIAEPMRLHLLRRTGDAPPTSLASVAIRGRRIGFGVITGVGLVALAFVIAAGYLLMRPATVPSSSSATVTASSQAPRLSIVVLPFANLSGDTEQDYFADGVTEDLITDLSRITGSFVIARNTSMSYKGRSVDVRQVGRDLGVRYVLEGSVRRNGSTARVNAQLIDAESGAHLWADRFDLKIADVFTGQNEIVGRLARALNLEIIEAEGQRAQRSSTNTDATDLALRAWAAIFYRPASRQANEVARGLAAQALALDPENAVGWTAMAYVHFRDYYNDWNARPPLESRDDAIAAAQKAVALNPRSADTQFVLGVSLNQTHEVERGVAALESAVALNRNLAPAYGALGFNLAKIGRERESLAIIDRAFVLSPRDPQAAMWNYQKGFALLVLGRADEAAASFRESIRLNPNVVYSNFFLAIAEVRRGDEAAAKAAMQEGLRRRPTARISTFRHLWQSDHPAFVPHREAMVTALRVAGMPD